jgi:hypothetical protein
MLTKIKITSHAYVSALLLLASVSAHAELVSYNTNGAGLVYSSVSNVTWTKDANLLGSMIGSRGFETVVNDIIAASPAITNTPNQFSPTGIYTLSHSDFSETKAGQATWFGAMAFVSYLNSIHYGASTEWRLPSIATTGFGYHQSTNGVNAGDEFHELFYAELHQEQPSLGVPYTAPQHTAYFDNEQLSDTYWTGTENTYDWPISTIIDGPQSAFVFIAELAAQGISFKDFMLSTPTDSFGNFVWAISPGQIAAVPEPESLTMLFAGLGILGFASRRYQSSSSETE